MKREKLFKRSGEELGAYEMLPNVIFLFFFLLKMNRQSLDGSLTSAMPLLTENDVCNFGGPVKRQGSLFGE